ncbi:MAG: citrate/2-methylcitrate synthase [Planctomycetota bacterium]
MTTQAPSPLQPNTSNAPAPAGLEGVVAGNSGLSMIDGANGRLGYRGIAIEPLAEQATFEECIYLLWHDALPNKAQLKTFRDELAALRPVPAAVWEVLKPLAGKQSLMDLVRTGVSALSAWDQKDVNVTLDDAKAHAEANLRMSKKLTAMMGTLVAGCYRLSTGKAPLAPKAELSHAGCFLYMVRGTEPTPEEERIFDAALTLHADHGFNASTFSARVTAATESDAYAAVTAAVGTLAGRLHGGANTKVMRMLEEVGELSNVVPYLEKVLARPKGRVMGFGHRVYKVEDPRATVLRRMAKDLTAKTGKTKWFEMSRKIEDYMKEQKGIFVNVDFFSASVYGSMGLDPELYTPIFAVSRVSGWLAHVMEQHADNRLIRPKSNYVGQRDRAFVPLDRR